MMYERVSMYEADDGHVHIYYHEDGDEGDGRTIYSVSWDPGHEDDANTAAQDYLFLAFGQYEGFWVSDDLDVDLETGRMIGSIVVDCNNTMDDVMESLWLCDMGHAGALVAEELAGMYEEDCEPDDCADARTCAYEDNAGGINVYHLHGYRTVWAARYYAMRDGSLTAPDIAARDFVAIATHGVDPAWEGWEYGEAGRLMSIYEEPEESTCIASTTWGDDMAGMLQDAERCGTAGLAFRRACLGMCDGED
mgnify:CR=1 FL=1